jgi:hypothetical protein
VQLTISNDGTRLAAANFAPGAEFDSTISAIAPNQFRAVLDTASGGCPEGAVGTYRWTLTDPGDLVGLTSIGDECASRGDALGRTWARSLANPTTVGAGYVDTMGAPFSVVLPDQTLAARTLPDMIEIGGTDGFSLMAFRNPQGFVDACSDKQARVPYQAGAKAFADFLQHNKALRTVSREELTIDGNHAIHIVTVEKPGACAQVPADGLYLWTPKDCQCHFVGGHDSLYLIDEPNGDTLMLEVSPVDETNPVERQIIDSIRLPATIPGG